jgi:stage II sporulation protein D
MALAVAGCPRVEVAGIPETATAEPLVRVGISAPPGQLTIGGGSSLLLTGPDGGGLTLIQEGTTGTVLGNGTEVTARVAGVSAGWTRTLTAKPVDSAGFVRLNGLDYRGELLLTSTPTGLRAVNLVGLEAYVAGVVNAEMGRRPPTDSAALLAQAVVSRTVAVRALGRYRLRGYDLSSTVADQAYGGVGSETALGWGAVRTTRAEVLTYAGAVIETFYHSTCGGRTEAVEAAFAGPSQPYLRSLSDRDPMGQAYCSISPRFRWREEWTGEAITRSIRENAVAARLAAELGAASDVQIGGRSPAGRVAELVVVSAGRAVPITGQQRIRQMLRLSDGGWLRSTQFSLQTTRSGGRIVRVVAEGGGNGHGVGMCQWGAVGRARAGASYGDILSAYFPGTEIRRAY